jgi:glycosyltransferase involved in cell wall biosynthesis
VRGLHSISTYVEEITQRDFLGGAKVELRTIPSFRPDEDDVELDGGAARYLERLPDGPFMLFVGALRRVKGVETLLEAYVRLETHVPLVLIGTRERDTPKRFPLGVVVIEGVPHDAVMLAWERCLFGVVPSLWPEPMGQVVHEAMSRGRAVIGTTPGGHADLVVDGETGLLVPAGDVTALADTMARLLADDALRERLGSAAREHSLQATAGRAMPAYEDLYARVAAGARGA